MDTDNVYTVTAPNGSIATADGLLHPPRVEVGEDIVTPTQARPHEQGLSPPCFYRPMSGLNRAVAIEPLAVSRADSSSSTDNSPSVLSDSGGKFRIGAFEIGRHGVTENNPPSNQSGTVEEHDPSACEPCGAETMPGIDFKELQMLTVIGRGASGFVRRAEHLPTGFMMAVKEICISDVGRRQQILKEIETLRAATARSASHLMQYLGVRYAEGSIQICMEYMDGGSLGDLVHRTGPLPTDALSSIIRQSLCALVELRECHLVHRDLKPQNILLSLHGHCKVADFGCVAELQDSFGKCGTFVGTVPYMSPERIQGEQYSYASDIWALGLTLVECASGEPPCVCVIFCSRKWHADPLLSPACPFRLQGTFRMRGGTDIGESCKRCSRSPPHRLQVAAIPTTSLTLRTTV